MILPPQMSNVRGDFHYDSSVEKCRGLKIQNFTLQSVQDVLVGQS